MQALHFAVTLSIRKALKGEQVCYKVDGSRFDNSKTIKLQSECMYRVELSFKPPQILEAAEIQETTVEFEEKSRDNTASAYSLVWSTDNNPVTKNGTRSVMPVRIKLRDIGNLQLILQTKFYKQEDTQHAEWGNTFHCVDYECKVNESRTVVSVEKETFR
ncbi:CNRIP1 (predicted) [Pycnogonum litorale]